MFGYRSWRRSQLIHERARITVPHNAEAATIITVVRHGLKQYVLLQDWYDHSIRPDNHYQDSLLIKSVVELSKCYKWIDLTLPVLLHGSGRRLKLK